MKNFYSGLAFFTASPPPPFADWARNGTASEQFSFFEKKPLIIPCLVKERMENECRVEQRAQKGLLQYGPSPNRKFLYTSLLRKYYFENERNFCLLRSRVLFFAFQLLIFSRADFGCAPAEEEGSPEIKRCHPVFCLIFNCQYEKSNEALSS